MPIHLYPLLSVCAGACLGATCRWWLSGWLNQPHLTWHGLQWGTWLANATGAYAMGLCMAWFDQYPDISPLWRVAVVTGFLGALTTFSTFSAEVVTLLHAQRWWSAAWVSAAHLGTCLALTLLGCYSMTLGLKWLHRG